MKLRDKLERRISKGAITFKEPSLTKQSFRDDCSIPLMMERYTRTGLLPKRRVSTYGIETGADFHMLNLAAANARSKFELLPPHIQTKYGNVGKVLELLHDPVNRAELAADGVFNLFLEYGAESPSITRSGLEAETDEGALDDESKAPGTVEGDPA